MDYHPRRVSGGIPRAEFQTPQHCAQRLGTPVTCSRCTVFFDNPNPMVADYPTAYEVTARIQISGSLSTWWDRDASACGEVENWLVTARARQTW